MLHGIRASGHHLAFWNSKKKKEEVIAVDITCRKRGRILHISKRVERGKHGGQEKGIACYCSYKQSKDNKQCR